MEHDPQPDFAHVPLFFFLAKTVIKKEQSFFDDPARALVGRSHNAAFALGEFVCGSLDGWAWHSVGISSLTVRQSEGKLQRFWQLNCFGRPELNFRPRHALFLIVNTTSANTTGGKHGRQADTVDEVSSLFPRRY